MSDALVASDAGDLTGHVVEILVLKNEFRVLIWVTEGVIIKGLKESIDLYKRVEIVQEKL
jgi:hypothetical protein